MRLFFAKPNDVSCFYFEDDNEDIDDYDDDDDNYDEKAKTNYSYSKVKPLTNLDQSQCSSLAFEWLTLA